VRRFFFNKNYLNKLSNNLKLNNEIILRYINLLEESFVIYELEIFIK